MISCRLCMYVGQFVLNVLNLADHTLNTLLLGDSDETVSARTARARAAGWRWASGVCKFLSWATKVVTFGRINHDHCVAALDKSVRPDSREIWNWNTMSINATPFSVIEVNDVGPINDA